MIFLDNLPAHYSKRVREQVEEDNWSLLYNAPYSSPFHCIENIFSTVKATYKRNMARAGFDISDDDHK